MTALDDLAAASVQRHRDAHASGAPAFGVDRTPRRLPTRIRAATAADMPLVLDSWRMSWRVADRCRDMRGRDYRAYWERVVRNGVLTLDDTHVTVAVAANRPADIYAWICHTPGAVPTVHYALTRERCRTSQEELRGLGMLRLLVAHIGVRPGDGIVYTSKPAERSNPTSKTPLHAERGLVEAAREAGITATYHSIEEFLERRGIR